MNLLRSRSPLAFGLLLAVGGFSGRAFAQAPSAGAANTTGTAPATASAATAPATVSAPDIVRLKNGGILRGTISELVPGDYVSIVLITGEARKVPFAEVLSAGAANDPANAVPVAAAPAAAVSFPSDSKPNGSQPFAVVHAAESRVSVVSEASGLTLFRRSASAGFGGGGTVSGYDEVCTTPCNVSMPAGTHTFAVAKTGGKPREADAVALPPGEATMTVANVDRTGIRVGVGVVGAAALVGGFALLLQGPSSETGSASTGKIVGMSLLVAAGAGLVGLAISLPDGAKVTVSPGAPAPVGKAAYNDSAPSVDARRYDAVALCDQLSGLTLRASF